MLGTVGYQVIRVEKLKSAARIAARIRHAMREKIPEHADPDRLAKNDYAIFTQGEQMIPKAKANRMEPEERTRKAMARFKGLLPAKFRKDAVQALELVLTASHDDLERLSKDHQDRAYLTEAYAWAIHRFGGPENVICSAIHRDETTAHVSMFVVPLVDRENGKALCAKNYLGGPKELAKLQTDFNEAVASKFGLKRGREFSPATHLNVREFYTMTNEVAKKVNLEREQARQDARDRKNKKGEIER